MLGYMLQAKLRIHEVTECFTRPRRDTKKLRELIKPKLDALDEIPYINNGGCAVVALELSKHIRRLGYKPEIVYLFRTYESNDYERAVNNEITTCSHAVVKVGGGYFDSSGELDADYLDSYKYKVALSPKYVKDTLERGDWNSCFNRGKYTPRIQEILR